METKIKKKIKGYTKKQKFYSKLNNNIICVEQNKKKKIISKFKTICIEVLKLFIIVNLINIMQFFIVHDEYVMNVFLIKHIKELGFQGYIESLGEAFNHVYWIGILVLVAIYIIFYSITNKKRISLIIVTLITYGFAVINYAVTDIRGSAVTLSDILSIRTALNVTTGINFNIKSDFIVGAVLTIITLIITIIFFRKSNKLKIRERVLMLIASIVTIVIIANTNYIKDMAIWNMNYTYTDNGVILTLFKLSTRLKVVKPKGYSKKEVEEILAEYRTESNFEESDINVIVIMNESFADYTKNPKIEMYEDSIPYFHALQKEENVITGIMHSDAFGGYTANIEYEFLTQNTTAFMPRGATPYQQYITNDIESLVSKMKNLGYITYGIHPWNKSGYRRDKVYKFLGFDYYKFREDYNDLEYSLNEYTKDTSAYSKIIEIFENKEKNDKIFSFNVTVQKHSPYDRLDPAAKTYSDDETMNIYLQNENESDLALEELISYLKDYDEKIILLFFGDHQPKTGIDEIVNDEENKYKVPYLIWANYDIDNIDYGDTSAIYLQSILMKTSGFPTDEYTNYMGKLREEIPVLTANYYIGNNGEKYNLDDVNSPYYEKIKEYEKIVYYKIFDN